jgi:hypothetical protein
MLPTTLTTALARGLATVLVAALVAGFDRLVAALVAGFDRLHYFVFTSSLFSHGLKGALLRRH